MLNRFVRALLILIFAPMVVLLIYMTIKNGESGFSQGWAMIVAQVMGFASRLGNSPKEIVTDVSFWKTIGAALAVAIFFKKS